MEEWEFIERHDKKDFSDADKIGDEKIKATLIGKRVAELYIDPLTAYFFINCLRNASDKKVNEFSFLQMVSHTLEIMPLLRVSNKDEESIQEYLIKFNDFLLEKEPSLYDLEYEEFINSIKTALMMHDWADEKDEEYLLENFNIRPGELRNKFEIADWLLYASEELSRMLHYQYLNKEIVKLRLRLRYGIKEELLSLIRLQDIGRVRARKLYSNKIKDIKDIKNADVAILSQILGKQIALSIKKQVGQETIPVKEGKRRGQISLEDY